MPFWKKSKEPKDKAPPPPDSIGGAETNPSSGPLIIDVGRKELYEDGLEFCGPQIIGAFAGVDIDLSLDDEGPPPDNLELDDDAIIRWLWIDEECIVEEYGMVAELELGDGSTTGLPALDWDLLTILRRKYNDPTRPDRNWQLGAMDDGYLLILAEPDELASIEQQPSFPGFGTFDLTGATEVRRSIE